MPLNRESPSLDLLNTLFYIQDSVLYWKIRRSPNVIINSEAGYINNKYRKCKINNTLYYIHRLMYQIYHSLEYIPIYIYIDHIDGDKLNNSKDNLRLATSSQNQQNKKYLKNNSGYKNIIKCRSKNRNNTYRYNWKVNIEILGKVYTRYFPYTDEGLQQAIEDANKKRMEIHGEFANNG